jgi:hypothetical protein
MRNSRQKVRLLQPDPKPRVIQSTRHLKAQLVESLRRVAVKSFASVAKPTAVTTRPTTPWTAVAMTATSQELKKVLIEIYCIKKCLLDLDPI